MHTDNLLAGQQVTQPARFNGRMGLNWVWIGCELGLEKKFYIAKFITPEHSLINSLFPK